MRQYTIRGYCAAVEVYQDRKRLQLHPEKSQCLRINKQTKNPHQEEVLLLNGKQMKMTSSYKYLGEYLNEKGTEATTVEKRCKGIQGVMNEILAIKSEALQHRRIEIGVPPGRCVYRLQITIQR